MVNPMPLSMVNTPGLLNIFKNIFQQRLLCIKNNILWLKMSMRTTGNIII
jgi:hypothetical protein